MRADLGRLEPVAFMIAQSNNAGVISLNRIWQRPTSAPPCHESGAAATGYPTLLTKATTACLPLQAGTDGEATQRAEPLRSLATATTEYSFLIYCGTTTGDAGGSAGCAAFHAISRANAYRQPEQFLANLSALGIHRTIKSCG